MFLETNEGNNYLYFRRKKSLLGSAKVHLLVAKGTLQSHNPTFFERKYLPA